MTSRIIFNIENMLDRGSEYGFLVAQVDFEKEAWPAKGMSFASVIVPLAKTEAGSMTFNEIRAAALSKTLSFMVNCQKNSVASS